MQVWKTSQEARGLPAIVSWAAVVQRPGLASSRKPSLISPDFLQQARPVSGPLLPGTQVL